MFQKLFGGFGQSTSPVEQITVQDLKAKLSSNDRPLLIDVRSAEEYAHDGHVAGSRLIPLPVLANRANELPKDKPIAVICRSGNRSQSGADVLIRLGFTNVMNVRGGMMAWHGAGFPTK